MRPNGPATTPRERGTEIEDLQTKIGLHLVERMGALEHAQPVPEPRQSPPPPLVVVPPEGPPESPQPPRRGTPLIVGIAVVAALAGGALLGHGLSSPVRKQSTDAAAGVHVGHVHAAGPALAALNYNPPTRHGVEVYQRPDPTLPKVPVGPVKKFRVDVVQHVTRVSQDTRPLQVWSFGVNRHFLSGTGGSPPIVVNQGDRVQVTFVNGANHGMHVSLPHSLDLHAEAADPGTAFPTINPGQSHTVTFVARNPGVYMYHCVSAPALLHVGAGMAGMFVVKPKKLPKVDHEIWLTQQEFYNSPSGHAPDYARMLAKKPTAMAFNGYASQYVRQPIKVKAGERLRIYLLNAGPSMWSAFHVIGGVFDRTDIEGVQGHDSQTVSIAPSQGGWVDMTLDQEGSYPFVTHAFGDVVLGADGALQTEHARGPVMEH